MLSGGLVAGFDFSLPGVFQSLRRRLPSLRKYGAARPKYTPWFDFYWAKILILTT